MFLLLLHCHFLIDKVCNLSYLVVVIIPWVSVFIPRFSSFSSSSSSSELATLWFNVKIEEVGGTFISRFQSTPKAV